MKTKSSVWSGLFAVTLALSPVGALGKDKEGLTTPSQFTITGPISTGTVIALAPDSGTMSIRSTQLREPLTFYGLNYANVVTGSGRAATLGNIQVGSPVTVYYTPRESRWVVSKVVIPEPLQLQPAPLPTLTGAEIRALQSSAANDDDITTQPASKARIDNDITTQPGKNALADPDITKRPR